MIGPRGMNKMKIKVRTVPPASENITENTELLLVPGHKGCQDDILPSVVVGSPPQFLIPSLHQTIVEGQC